MNERMKKRNELTNEGMQERTNEQANEGTKERRNERTKELMNLQYFKDCYLSIFRYEFDQALLGEAHEWNQRRGISIRKS